MQDIYLMRLFVRIVDELSRGVDRDIEREGLPFYFDGTDRLSCIKAFVKKYPKYSEDKADELCDSALARGYILYPDSLSVAADEKRLRVEPLKGRALLTTSGYLDELAGVVGKLSPLLTWLVAFLALAVSVLVAIFK